MMPGKTRKLLFWAALDLLALALVAALVGGTIAVHTGRWWPMDYVAFDYWPLFAYTAWLMVVAFIGVLLGVQFGALTAETRPESATSRAETESRPISMASATPVEAVGPPTATPEATVPIAAREVETEERELVPAGR